MDRKFTRTNLTVEGFQRHPLYGWIKMICPVRDSQIDSEPGHNLEKAITDKGSSQVFDPCCPIFQGVSNVDYLCGYSPIALRVIVVIIT